MPRLRRNKLITSIHASLAIEGNTLSKGQVRDIIDGKEVVGPANEIKEVQNIKLAYEQLTKVKPYSEKDLLKIHGIIEKDLVPLAGKYRTGNEGVFAGDKCIFICPPPQQVPYLMSELFDWLNREKKNIDPLILSSIFHYEFVFIHPFQDGNGRTARFWQNAILSKYDKIFEVVTIENMIEKNQQEYYDAIAKAHVDGESTVFVEFMLDMINKALDELDMVANMIKTEASVNVKRLLENMEEEPMTANEIMFKLDVKHKDTLRNKYLNCAIRDGYVQMTIPDKPKSKNQRYYKTHLDI
jgi:Fic family protein